MKPISKNATQAIEEALTRLAANPGSGKLTAARLSAEAGVSRATVYRAPQLLRRLRALEVADVAEPRTAADRIREFEALVVALRRRESDELLELRAANRHLAQHIQALSLLVQDQQRRLVVKA
mgnify:CR=1 FL=1|jgi:putative NADH-flavin reductase